MIPTMFGITVVSFLIMQLAPGDPELTQIGSGGTVSQSGQTRESYVLMKRDLNLDKPILLNFDYFRDFGQQVDQAAWFLSLGKRQLAQELARLEPPSDEEAQARLTFLRSLRIPKFDEQLRQPTQRVRLLVSIPAYVRSSCEDLGLHGVPGAIAILESDQPDLQLRRGAIRALSHMVPEPFVFTYSRKPSDAETPQVTSSWKLWWDRQKSSFSAVSPDRREAIGKLFQGLVRETSRAKIRKQLDKRVFKREDVPYFAEVLLGNSSLPEKALAAQVLRLLISAPLSLDVSLDAASDEVDRVAANWLIYFDLHKAECSPGVAAKTWYIVGDTQYAHMVWRLVTFNFGRSALKTREPVSERIWNAVKVSAPLMFMSEVLIYLVAIPLGILCAVKRGKLVDRLIQLGLFLLYSIPPFVAGMLFLLFLCYGGYLKWFPMERLSSDGADEMTWGPFLLDYFWHAFLPVVCLSLFSLAGMAMYSRSSMLDVIGQDFVRSARAKGVSEGAVIFKHVLRNALIPIVTLFSTFLPAMLGGSVLVESLFNIQGMGWIGFYSIMQKDFPTLMALIYVEAIIVLVSILLTDLLYVLIDPRISFASQKSGS